MKQAFVLLWLVPLALSCDSSESGSESVAPPEDAPLAALVDPFIGTANEGQTYPGAVVPNGLASVSPRTTLNGPLDLLGASFLEGGLSFSGYLAGEEKIHGFGLTQLSGVGCPDMGMPMIVPGAGEMPTRLEEYGSAFEDERAFAGYYGVRLTDRSVSVDVTATTRTGLMRFAFENDSPYVLIDVANAISVIRNEGSVEIVSPTEVEGSAAYGQFCMAGNAGRVYFVARFDQPASDSGLIRDGVVTSAQSGEAQAGWLSFEGGAKVIHVQVGVSYTGIDGARANLEAEASDFDAALKSAARAWQEKLGRVEVEGGTTDQQRMFYTALYHSLIHPNIASDVDGAYLSYEADQRVLKSDQPTYTLFSLWDTYRTTHPLLTLLYPELQTEMLRTMSEMTLSFGRPPKWELAGDETYVMVGDPAAIVLADSYVKGLTDFPLEEIYPHLIAASEDPQHRLGVDAYLELGYLPMELAGSSLFGNVWGPASTTLEYALSDWALGQLALGLGLNEEANALAQRAIEYRTLYDASTGTLRPKFADGTFLEPFDPDLFIDEVAAGTGGPGYVEGTAWQYAFMVPHDVPALVELHGEENFVERLQQTFDLDRFTSYNEPDLAYPYFFTFVDGEAHRTQRTVREVIDRDYGVGPYGLPGNDDTGTLSAWLAFSMMGFYPVTPGAPEYRLGSPVFDKITLRLTAPYHSGDAFTIAADGNGPDSVYIQQATLNGTAVRSSVLSHAEIIGGGELLLKMGAQPAR